MAKQSTERKRKVPMVKLDDMQKTSNASVDATMHSFEGVTKTTQAIATEIADYTKRSFENGTKTMENLLGAKSLDKAFEVQSEYAESAYGDYVGLREQAGTALHRSGKRSHQAVPGPGRESDSDKVIASEQGASRRLGLLQESAPGLRPASAMRPHWSCQPIGLTVFDRWSVPACLPVRARRSAGSYRLEVAIKLFLIDAAIWAADVSSRGRLGVGRNIRG